MTNKKFVAIFLAVGLLLSIGCVVGQQRMVQAEKYTLLNLTNFAEKNPVDPKLGLLMKQAAIGKNASINLTQLKPGYHFGEHYHNLSDEIQYVIQGQANMTVDGKVVPIKSGDLVYLPSSSVVGYDTLGNETFVALVVFAPPLNEKDRIFV